MISKKQTKKGSQVVGNPGPASAPKKGKVFSIPNGATGTMLILLNIPLHGEVSRARNRLARIFDAHRTVCLAQQEKIQQKYAAREEDGSFKKPPQGAPEPYVIPPLDVEVAEKEFMAFLDQPFEVELDTENKRALALMRPHILESKVEMQTGQGSDYDLICAAFEAI